MNKEEYITKEYFDEKTKDFVTNDSLDKKLDERFKLQMKELKQHTQDLTTGFREEVRVVCDQVSALGDKIDHISKEVSEIKVDVKRMDQKINTIQDDITLIKDVLPEKADKTEVVDLRRRVIRLEKAKI